VSRRFRFEGGALASIASQCRRLGAVISAATSADDGPDRLPFAVVSNWAHPGGRRPRMSDCPEAPAFGLLVRVALALRAVARKRFAATMGEARAPPRGREISPSSLATTEA
jgi:hypothetical protein